MSKSRRVRASLVAPVTIHFDGEAIVAEKGEPVAAALVAAGKSAIARSPKFHRPRGPSCFRAACDGCLARVDDAPNVMTCLTPAREGMVITSQNKLGFGDIDLLRMTDWFFPDGMNHHELFAGVPGVQTVMQAFARRVAGLGKLPAHVEPPRRAERRRADVVVVGAGPAGMAIASKLAACGRTVEVLDDQQRPGGSLRALAPSDLRAFDDIRKAFASLVSKRQLTLKTRTVAGGLYGRDLLVVSEDDGAQIVEARTLILACGAHDGVAAFEGNDLPGVMSARAAGFLLASGVLPGSKIAVVLTEGGGPFGDSFVRAVKELSLAKPPRIEVRKGTPISTAGSSNVAKLVIQRDDGKTEKLAADAVLVDAPRAPAYELAMQAGATLVHEPRGYRVEARRGRIGDGVFAVGEMTGIPLDAAAIDHDSERAVQTILG